MFKNALMVFVFLSGILASNALASSCDFNDPNFDQVDKVIGYLHNEKGYEQRPPQSAFVAAKNFYNSCNPSVISKLNLDAYIFPDDHVWEFQSFVDPTSMETLGWGVHVVNDKGYRMQLMCAADNMSELLMKIDMTDVSNSTNFELLNHATQDLGKNMSVDFGFDRAGELDLQNSQPWIIEGGSRKVISTSLDIYLHTGDILLVDMLKAKASGQFYVHLEGFDGRIIDTEFSLLDSIPMIKKLLVKCGIEEK